MLVKLDVSIVIVNFYILRYGLWWLWEWEMMSKRGGFFFFKIKKSFNVKNFFLSICILG